MSEAISRRGFMVAAGGAGLLPVGAARSAVATEDERLRACIIEIRGILQRRHPVVDVMHDGLISHEDGTFDLSIAGRRKFEAYSGEGIYELSISGGCVATYWLQQDVQRRVSDGSPIPGGEFCWGRRLYDGEFIDGTVRMSGRPNIIRKLEDWEAGRAIE